MDQSNVPLEQDEGPQIPAEPVPEITSRFLFVDVAALRAKQLRRGARVRFRDGDGPPAMHKAERVAMEEVRRGLVYYDVPTTGAGTDRPAGDATGGAGSAKGLARDDE
jgi:DNA-directed RNA polymerase subunit K/omega